MIFFVVKRLAFLLVTLAVLSVLVFGMTQVLPGNVAYAILGADAAADQVAMIEQKLGLHDPVVVQYWRWASAFVRGDFGTSMMMNRPVGPLVLDALGRSAVLAALALFVVSILGITLGVLAAVRHGRPADYLIGVVSYICVGLPEFLWAIVGIMVFSVWLGWLPATGYSPSSAGLWPWLKHLLLPVTTLVFGFTAHICRLTRSSMLEELNSPYITAARAKGLSERRVVLKHALVNAMLPTITVIAADAGILLGGIVVVEVVFSYSGLGRLLVFGIEHKDLPIIQASILVVACIYATANLLADLAYFALNPRVRAASLEEG